jgi:hypothetical protein
MSLRNSAADELKRIGSIADQEQIVKLGGPAARLECELVALDSLACAFTRLSVFLAQDEEPSIESLRQRSEQLASRVCYLLEPIRPLEVDLDEAVVQMRSVPPQAGENGTSYYELLVRRDGEIRLSRYKAQRGQARRPIPAQVTREVFVRLVGDLEAPLD